MSNSHDFETKSRHCRVSVSSIELIHCLYVLLLSSLLMCVMCSLVRESNEKEFIESLQDWAGEHLSEVVPLKGRNREKHTIITTGKKKSQQTSFVSILFCSVRAVLTKKNLSLSRHETSSLSHTQTRDSTMFSWKTLFSTLFHLMDQTV